MAKIDYSNYGGESKSAFKKVELTSIVDTIDFLGTAAAQIIADEMDKKDVSSSGRLQDSINALGANQVGTKIVNDIEALDYFDYEDKGVDGWAKSRGSRFKFKTKGVDPKGEMVRSVKEWLVREGKSASNSITKYAPSKRESRGRSILDASTKKALAVSYMIKRFGIKAKNFTGPAERQIAELASKELNIAIEVDIVNNLTN